MKIKCKLCGCGRRASSGVRTIYKIGKYWRKSDGHWIQRFWCQKCEKGFSSALFGDTYRQKKRNKNEPVRKLLSAGVSQREAARILKINRKTVVRKFLFLSVKENLALDRWNKAFTAAREVEFDDLETFEHTKCKPLSVSLMVEYKTRRILGFEVSQMPAKGRIAQFSRKKYGNRPDKRAAGRKKLFERVKTFVDPNGIIRSDSNPHYPPDITKHFPTCAHQTVMGGRGSNTGQGELKRQKFDPIFSLNHTCAMLRANINRLFRKTWCTTKRPDRLAAHISLYVMSHNRRLSTA